MAGSQKKQRTATYRETVEENKVVELHVGTYELARKHDFLTLTVSKGGGVYLRFLVVEYEHAKRELEGAKLGNSKLMVDGNRVFLLLALSRDVEVREHRNKLVVDINEDSVDCLLVDYDSGGATLFSIKHDIRRIRANYRRMRMRIQEKVGNPALRDKLLAKYGSRERRRVEDRLRKIAALLAEIAREHKADLVRENLRDLRVNGGRRSKQLNYRLSTFPYRELIGYADSKFYECGLSVVEADARRTSTDCPVCRHSDRGNRISKETFKCRKCSFTFNAQYVACLNLYTRSNDGLIAIRSGALVLVPRKAGPVVPVEVAPDGPPNVMRWLREKPVQVSKVTLATKR